jgi:hypothetical protein
MSASDTPTYSAAAASRGDSAVPAAAGVGVFVFAGFGVFVFLATYLLLVVDY